MHFLVPRAASAAVCFCRDVRRAPARALARGKNRKNVDACDDPVMKSVELGKADEFCQYNLYGQIYHPSQIPRVAHAHHVSVGSRCSSPMTPQASVRKTITSGIARIEIDRADRRNAMNDAAWQRLTDICGELAQDRSVRGVVLTGAGEHFCAGADIHELRAHISSAEWMQRNQANIATAIDRYANLPQPTIAAIRGACYGGGAALAAASDFRIAADTARFAITPAKLGLTYRLVDCQRIVELVGAARARELLLLSMELSSAAALDWGFINTLIAADELDQEVDRWTTKLMSLSAYSQRGIKTTLLKIRNGVVVDDAETKATFAAAFAEPDFVAAAEAFASSRK
jgi:enoyl-CoA hydratase